MSNYHLKLFLATAIQGLIYIRVEFAHSFTIFKTFATVGLSINSSKDHINTAMCLNPFWLSQSVPSF